MSYTKKSVTWWFNSRYKMHANLQQRPRSRELNIYTCWQVNEILFFEIKNKQIGH